MHLNILPPRKSLNKAFLKVKPSRREIELFKKNLLGLLDGLDEKESEEHNKNDLCDFLKNTWYAPGFYLNTKGRNDLVIHTGADSKSLPGVLIEVKKPGNKAEMVHRENLNAKAFHELVLYYLRERITGGNLEIKHLIATNIYEWFIFDATVFEKIFAQNKSLVKQFTDFEEGRLAGTTTDFFYNAIAEPFISGLSAEIEFTWFDIRQFDAPLRNDDKADDAKLISLFKVLSPEHLLKLPFSNDSNSLDKSFYAELLHIIGLTETKSGSKKLIGRKPADARNPGSLLENAIMQLEARDKISRLQKPSQFGDIHEERLFNVSLELVITWLNRILFLKLLEAQLIRYHKGSPEYGFLNTSRISGFDDLDNLFFRVLARKTTERDPDMVRLFGKVPYLNSSLFEPTELEHQTIFISNLQDNARIPIAVSTVLKDNTGKKRSGNLNGLQYLFEFLDSYDFAGEGTEDIQEDNKTLINASVLGLIFEKLNGYKDGSFFTPGFITMYMCRETIRRAVVQKFNDLKGWNCDDFTGLYNKIEDLREANQVINTLKICDPAVGSGHFLVSALNEIIAIKSDLKILTDRDGKRLKEYHVEVVNDELIITDEDGKFFEYNPANRESQRIQEAIFHEKQTIIENCLFGVDINPNSVKICRLRLWIELLKSAYYKAESALSELETLPNIDINIKCGNSLISRYALDADIRQALKSSKWSIDSYRAAVMSYRNASGKEEKREMERLIESIKNDFETEVVANDKRLVQLRKLNGDLFNLTQQTSLFDQSKKEKDAWNKKVADLTAKIGKIETEMAEIKSNKIYENAFEWRFEFPEVLNDEGDFVGFDVVIGNPPYGVKFSTIEKQFLLNRYSTIDDIYSIFIEKGMEITKDAGTIALIIPIFWMTGTNYLATRKLLKQKGHLHQGIILPYDIFADAYIDTGIFIFTKKTSNGEAKLFEFNPKDKINIDDLNSITFNSYPVEKWEKSDNLKIVVDPNSRSLDLKLGIHPNRMMDITDSIRGVLANPEDYSEIPLTEEYKPIFIGKLDRYSFEEKFQYIKYGENLKEKPASSAFFEGDRILIRRIVNRQFRIMASITSAPFVNKKDIYIFKPNSTEFSSKYLLAILNSKLISYWKTKSSTTAKKDDFTQLTLNDIREIRIPKPEPQVNSVIENLVDELLSMKKLQIETKAMELESKIDFVIYQLYSLTDTEIRIIEGETN